MSGDEIRRELEAARADARWLAAEQQAWRERVGGLVERAHDAGLSVEEIAGSLGLSEKWTEHLERRARHRRHFRPGTSFYFFGEP